MTNTLLIILIVLSLVSIILSILALTKKTAKVDFDGKDLIENVKRESDQSRKLSEVFNANLVNSLNNAQRTEKERLSDLSNKVDDLIRRNEYRLTELTKALNEDFKYLAEVTEKQLTEIRLIVDEKLQQTLEQRLQGSYKIIADNLDTVSKGIGEVKKLAEGVGDIKKVFSNSKLRGTWGEMQLNSLLEQMLSPEQFVKNFRLNPQVDAFVDYAVVLPGKDGEITYLPIDSKFPIEEYQRIINFEDVGDIEQAEKSSKAFYQVVKKQAEDIASKYIIPPKTTDFAIIYFPIEGLYAEVIKNAELSETLRKLRIMPCGPTNLGALLNSLQTGFRTLKIEKRSSELWQLLSAFKTEFMRFAVLLDKTGKKLREAQDVIDDAKKRTDIIDRKLKGVAEITGEDITERLEDE